LLLAVDGHALADELAEIDVVQGAAEGKVDAVVEHALALHAPADAGLHQQIARPLLDQTGADAALDIVAAAVFQDDALHALEGERKGEQARAGGPGAGESRRGAALLPPGGPRRYAHWYSKVAGEKRQTRDWLAHFRRF